MFIIAKSKLFEKHYQNFPQRDKEYIARFIAHILTQGFSGLEGRNKQSDDVLFSDPDFVKKVEYATNNHLWHYHIGILQYDLTKPYGDRTSEYILHYQRLGEVVKIVDYSPHPPFQLPTENYLE